MMPRFKLMTAATLAAMAPLMAIPPKDGDDDANTELDARLNAALERMTKSHGADSAAAGRELLRENFKEREKSRELKRLLEEANAKLPEGHVALAKADADELAEWRKLGKVAEIGKELETGRTNTEKVAANDRAKSNETLAKELGFNASVLTRLLDHDGVTIETVTVKQGDKDVKGYNVKKADGTTEELSAYTTREWTDFIPSLKVTGDGGNGQQGQPLQQPNPAIPFPAMGGGTQGDGGNTDDLVKTFQQRRDEVHNPLAPPKK